MSPPPAVSEDDLRMTNRLANYDVTVAGPVGQGLWALLAEYDLDGERAELVLRDLRVDAATLSGVVERARALGLAVVAVRHRTGSAHQAAAVRPADGTGHTGSPGRDEDRAGAAWQPARHDRHFCHSPYRRPPR
jgi:hypothetical protein